MFTHLVRFAAILLLCCLPLAGAAQAQVPAQGTISPEKMEAIKQLMEVTDAANNAKLVMKQLIESLGQTMPSLLSKSMSDQVGGKNLTPAQQAEVDKATEAFMAKEMKWATGRIQQAIDFQKLVETVFVPLYDKYYTEQELRDLIAFYKTPTGQKSMLVSPQLAGEAATRSSEFLKPALQQTLQDMQEQMAKHIQNLSDELERITNLNPPPPPKSPTSNQ
jgi:hypothetical protein